MPEEAAPINACSRLEAVLNGLDPRARTMMQAYLEGLSISQIAASLDRGEADIREELRTLLPQVQARLNG